VTSLREIKTHSKLLNSYIQICIAGTNKKYESIRKMRSIKQFITEQNRKGIWNVNQITPLHLSKHWIVDHVGERTLIALQPYGRNALGQKHT
jgi:hypothetical protein